MQDVFIEYMVKKQKTPATVLLKLLIGAGAAAVVLGALLFGRSLGIFSLFAPLLAVGAVYGAYHLIISMNIEYEYAVTNGELDVDRIVAQRRRKRLVTVDMRQVEAFGRYDPAQHREQSYQTKILACDNPASHELWYCTAHLGQGGRTLVVFNANQKMLDAIGRFLPRPIFHQAFPKGQ